MENRCLKILLLYAFFLNCNFCLYAQIELTLSQAIELAQQNGLQLQMTRNNYEVMQQNLKIQRAQLLPQVNLSANLPGYSRSISSVTQPDGTDKFINVEQALSSVGLNFSQNILATGGKFTLGSNLNRIDRFTGINTGLNYNSQPYVLGYSQPMFSFNQLKHSLKISEINSIVASKSLVKSQQINALQVIQFYYLTLNSQENINLTQFNLEQTDTLLQLATSQLKLGKIGEEEYLQLEMQRIALYSQNRLAKTTYSNAKNKLCALLKLPQETVLVLNFSSPLTIELNYDKLLFPNNLGGNDLNFLISKAKQNNPEYDEQKASQLQNEASLKQAKLNLMPALNLRASIGTNQSANAFNDAYSNVRNQQNITMSVAIPLYTGGANIASYKIANYAINNQKIKLQIFERQIENDLQDLVNQYNYSIEAIKNAQLTDSLSQKRYSILLNKYKAGKLTYTDLLNAQYERDQLKINYINNIGMFWSVYYQLRIMTLYDLEKQVSIYRGD